MKSDGKRRGNPVGTDAGTEFRLLIHSTMRQHSSRTAEFRSEHLEPLRRREKHSTDDSCTFGIYTAVASLEFHLALYN